MRNILPLTSPEFLELVNVFMLRIKCYLTGDYIFISHMILTLIFR